MYCPELFPILSRHAVKFAPRFGRDTLQLPFGKAQFAQDFTDPNLDKPSSSSQPSDVSHRIREIKRGIKRFWRELVSLFVVVFGTLLL